MSTSDLALLLVPPPSAAVRYGQGKILTWDPDTFDNTIEFRGVTLFNVPVLSSVQALGFQTGDTVGLLGWAPSSGGMGSWWIIGKLAIPGTDSPDLVVRGSNIKMLGGGHLRFNTNTLSGEADGELRPFVSGEARAALLMAPSRTIGGVGDGPHLILEGRTNATPDGLMFLLAPGGNLQLDAGELVFVRCDNEIQLNAGTGMFAFAGGAISLDSATNEVFITHQILTGSANAAFTGDLLFEVSSSRKAKQDIRDFTVSPRTVLDLQPRTWRDKNEVKADPDTTRWHVGLIAEEVDEAGLQAFVDYDQAGQPNAVTYDRLTIGLLELCREQQRQLDDLTAWAQAHGYQPQRRIVPETRLPKRTPAAAPARPQPQKTPWTR